LARPLLASVDAELVARIGAGAAVSLTPAPDELASNLTAAQGCAARGDWRCAVNFFAQALSDAPDDSEIVTALYEAYLALGTQEATAGRLDSARMAFANATEIDPTRQEATAALDRLAPYERAIVVDTFEGPERFVEEEEGDSRSTYEDGAFRLEISQAGLVSGYPLHPDPLAGEDFAAVLRIAECAGDGMVTIETRTDPAGGQWVFAVDPIDRTWEVLQFDSAEGRFTPWSGPYAYDAATDLETVELRVTDGFPLLLINGVDVAASAHVALPEVGNQGEVSFGALMESEGTTPFSVSFEEIALYELA
jgi:hypothetical protein